MWRLPKSDWLKWSPTWSLTMRLLGDKIRGHLQTVTGPEIRPCY